MRWAIFLASLLLISSGASSQEIFQNCGMEGDAKDAVAQQLNRLKNRYTAPDSAEYDTSVSLAAMVAPGSDMNRWSDSSAAEVVGYVYDVKNGGRESCNCHASNPLYRDTHIELVLDPMSSGGNKRVIVEVTPRWRAMMKASGTDWSTATLRTDLLGRWVKVRGWLMFDVEHVQEAENTNPGRAGNWRATAWEIHPVCSIEVVQRPQ